MFFCDIKRGATDRDISSAQADLTDDIKSWLLSDEVGWHKHPLTDQFLSALARYENRDLRQLPCGPQDAFRMQWVVGKPTATRMGAPEESQAPAGRYNEQHVPVLYLCLQYQGAIREMERPNSQSREALWLQKYRLPLDELSVLDVRATGGDNWVRTVFDYCETSERERDSDKPYPCSRRIAGLVKRAGYNCMLVPGVRGDPTFHYTNAIVFQFGLHRGCKWQVGSPEPVFT
jgi:RES domain-containing protein